MTRASRLAGATVTVLLAAAAPASAANFVVTNNFDVGAGSLRQAITGANAAAGDDTISFADLGSNNKITPDTPLPTITSPVTIDGYTHPGASPNTLAVGDNAVLKVELSGEDFLGGTPSGLTIGISSTVRGLAINRFEGAAIHISGGNGTIVEGNFIGTDLTGTLDLTSPASVGGGVLVDGSGANLIGGAAAAARNVVSGNGADGIEIRGLDSSGNVVQGNYIGTTKSGVAALRNDESGVAVAGAADTLIGGATALARNVISANGEGVSIDGDATARTVVRGNRIGTNAAGTRALGNAGIGIDNFGGDEGTFDGNVVSGNASVGVNVRGDTTELASGNTIRGNRIGTNAAGTAALGNGFDGMQIQSTSPGTTVGGEGAGARNIISGNDGYGVHVSDRNSRIQGNFIGTNASGAAAIPNDDGGVIAFASGVGLQIGGTTAAARNVVSGNDGPGIHTLGFAEVIGNYVGLNAAGTGAVPNEDGVRAETQTFIGLTASGRVPAGNVISGNANAGVLITGDFSSSVEVDDNLIGTNPAGTGALPNGDGVVVTNGGSGAALGITARNVISGNDFAGVLIRGPGFGHNTLQANTIGLNRAGTAPLPNGTGVEIAAGASENAIGSSFTAQRNVIAGNRFEGIRIHGAGTERNTVSRALVGLRPDGAAQPNQRGVVIAGGASLNTIGGSSGDLANTISGNTFDGVLITGDDTSRNTVRGNRIGTSLDGTAARPNLVGVSIAGGARFNTVGGALNRPASQISGNRSAGVRVADAGTLGNRVHGNLIGTGPAGTTGLPNGAGVFVTAGAEGTTIGGSGALGNRIGFNAGSGVLIEGAGTTGVNLIRNSVFRNGGLAINLRPASELANVVTANDVDDPDSGPNELQNFPVITAATGVPGTTTISGTLNSRPSAGHRVEVFRNPAAGPDPEAETFVGVVNVTTNAGGDATWSMTVPTDLSGQVLRATATAFATRSTSELSATRTVG